MMVPVRSLAEVQALDAGKLDAAALNRACRAVGTECVMVFTTEVEALAPTISSAHGPLQTAARVHVRMFAPLLGVPEDPATGSANGALGAYLVQHRVVPLDRPTVSIVSEQGSEIGRPSTLYVEVDHQDGTPLQVRVGGSVVPVAEGVVRF
jgi:trans-2,3-dihydro-3-hydroxyanthranilate isomerase